MSFQMFKEGSPSASADFQGAFRLYYNSVIYQKLNYNSSESLINI